MNVTASLLAVASHATYNDSPSVPSELASAGFSLYVPEGGGTEPLYYADADTGFGAQVWHNETTGEYVVALRGTDFTSPKDWYTNVQLGEPQFNSQRANDLKIDIGNFLSPSKIHFTGHSLGGALAQYFANEFASTTDSIAIELTTFNALGGIALFELDNNIDLNSTHLSDIDAVHYIIPGDAVSRLGNGHLGGNVRELNITDNRSPIEAHAMSLFLNLPNSVFEGATSVSPDYLSIDTAQAIASAMSTSTASHLLSDDGQFSNVEASARLVAGLIPALMEAPSEELNDIVEAFLPDSQVVQVLVSVVLEVRPVLELFPQFERGKIAAQGIAAVLFMTTQKLNETGVSNAEIDAFTAEAASLFSSLNDFWSSIAPAEDSFHQIVEQGASFYQYVFGTDNNDQFVSGRFNIDDVIDGDTGNDTFHGLTGADTLRGFEGRDRLYGNEGADHLYGGKGNDILSGGADADIDTYYYETGDGHDTIIDGDSGGDRILVDGADLATLHFIQIAAGSSTYRVEDQDISILKGAVDSTIFIGTGDEQGSITLNAYSDGNFGIALQRAEEFAEPETAAGARDLEALGEKITGGSGYYANSFFDRSYEAGLNDDPVIYNGDDYWSENTFNFLTHDFSGTLLNDRLIGVNDVVGDFILGLDGDDFIDGGSGIDFLEGNAGSDTIFGGEGGDYIYGDTLEQPRIVEDRFATAHEVDEESDGAQNYIDGEAGDDYLAGGKYEDIIAGSEGDDFLSGHAGNDILSGGVDDDWLFGDSFLTYEFGDPIYEGIHIVGQEIIRDIDYITSSESNLEYADFIDGGDGNDFIFGEVGDDIIHGGKGEDKLWGDRSIDDPDGELDAALNGRDTIYGGENADDIFGGGNDDLLHGGSGNDLIFGDGDTIPEEAQGDDVIFGGAGNDEVHGGAGDDRLSGDAGADLLFGEKGKDTLYGGSGNDELDGGQQDDQLYGEADHDLLVGNEGNDHLYGGAGDDELQGGNGNDLLVAGAGRDVLFGDAGNDELDGGAGNDMLQGNAGDDTLKGGGGQDLLEGGAGKDTYVFALGDGGAGVNDTSGATTLHFDGVMSLTQLRLVQNETHTTIYYGNDNSDWVSMDNASFAYVTHVELASKRFDRGQLFQATSITRSGDPQTNIDIGAIDLEPSDIRIFGRNDRLLFNTRNYGSGPESANFGDIDGVKNWFPDWGGSIGDVSFTDLNGYYVTPDEATNVQLENWYGLDPNDRPNLATFINGGAFELIEPNIDRTFDYSVLTYGSVFDDELAGGDGYQELVGLDGNDILLGFGGDDILLGGNNDDKLEGGSGNDSLKGGSGDDVLLGDSGRDWLFGESGNDVLWGGSGDGTMDGGEGDDIYIVDRTLRGTLTINDFAGADQILFQGIAFHDVYFEQRFNDLDVWIDDQRLSVSNAFSNTVPVELEDWVFDNGESYSWQGLQQSFAQNIAPIINQGISDIELDVEELLTYDPQPGQFTDPDSSDHLRYSFLVADTFATNQPIESEDAEAGHSGESVGDYRFDPDVAKWLQVDSNSGLMTGAPSVEIDHDTNQILSSDIGEYVIQYRASDRFDGHATSEFKLSVTDENAAIDPRVGLDDIEIEVGETLHFTLPYHNNIFFGGSQATVGVSLNQYVPESLASVSNIDGFIYGDDYWLADPFDFEQVVADDPAELPDWLNYDGATKTFYGTPGIENVNDNFVVHAWLSNGGETFAFEHSFNVSVVDPVSGTANIRAGDDQLFGVSGQSITVGFSELLANDLQLAGEPLQLVAVESQGQGSVNLDSDGELITYTPGSSENSARLVYEVTDGVETQSANLEISFALGELLSDLDDYYAGDKKNNRVLGSHGDDTLKGRKGDDELFGGSGNDLLKGGAGADRLFGELGNDVLKGSSGNDILNGGAGDDLLRGGEGNDGYQFAPGFGRDKVNNKAADFRDSHDVVEFLHRINAGDLWFSRQNDHLLVDVIGSDDSLKIKNWYRDDQFKVDEFRTADDILIEQSVEQLVQAMAAFDPPQGVGAHLSQELSDLLLPQIGAVWEPRIT